MVPDMRPLDEITSGRDLEPGGEARKGAPTGRDIDLSRLVARALFGDPTRIRFERPSDEARWSAIRNDPVERGARAPPPQRRAPGAGGLQSRLLRRRHDRAGAQGLADAVELDPPISIAHVANRDDFRVIPERFSGFQNDGVACEMGELRWKRFLDGYVNALTLGHACFRCAEVQRSVSARTRRRRGAARSRSASAPDLTAPPGPAMKQDPSVPMRAGRVGESEGLSPSRPLRSR